MWSARCASCWLDALMGKRAFDLLLSAALLLLLAPLWRRSRRAYRRRHG